MSSKMHPSTPSFIETSPTRCHDATCGNTDWLVAVHLWRFSGCLGEITISTESHKAPVTLTPNPINHRSPLDVREEVVHHANISLGLA